jgi:hypothetical protein
LSKNERDLIKSFTEPYETLWRHSFSVEERELERVMGHTRRMILSRL